MDCTVHGVGHDLALPFLRRGKETGDRLVGGAARTHTFVKFAILSNKRSLWSPITIVTSKITDHRSPCNNNEKYCENYQNVTQRHKVCKCFWKSGALNLLEAKLP